jgi:hypothetical protein
MNAGTEPREGGRLLVQRGVEALLPQQQRGGNPAEPGSKLFN